MEIRKIKKDELKETMDLAWNVFLKFEAPVNMGFYIYLINCIIKRFLI